MREHGLLEIESTVIGADGDAEWVAGNGLYGGGGMVLVTHGCVRGVDRCAFVFPPRCGVFGRERRLAEQVDVVAECGDGLLDLLTGPSVGGEVLSEGIAHILWSAIGFAGSGEELADEEGFFNGLWSEVSHGRSMTFCHAEQERGFLD